MKTTSLVLDSTFNIRFLRSSPRHLVPRNRVLPFEIAHGDAKDGHEIEAHAAEVDRYNEILEVVLADDARGVLVLGRAGVVHRNGAEGASPAIDADFHILHFVAVLLR